VALFLPKHDLSKVQLIENGIFKYYDFFNEHLVFQVLIKEQNAYSCLIETFTKDNLDTKVNFKFSFKILDVLNVLDIFGVKDGYHGDFISESVKVFCLENLNEIVKLKIKTRDALILNNEKHLILNEVLEEIRNVVNNKYLKVEILDFQLVNVVMPKSIMNLVASEVENQMKAKMELEAARTKVAVARTLKNASDLLKGDEIAMELKKLDVIEKIGGRGKTQIVFNMKSEDGVIKKI
jgi:regulator of protease activity HflC (stomatin/prohibitin superfamily)